MNSNVYAHNVPHNGSGRSRKVHELSGVISLIKPVFNKDFAGDVVMRSGRGGAKEGKGKGIRKA